MIATTFIAQPDEETKVFKVHIAAEANKPMCGTSGAKILWQQDIGPATCARCLWLWHKFVNQEQGAANARIDAAIGEQTP